LSHYAQTKKLTPKKFFSLDKDAQSKNSTIANKFLGKQNLIFKQLTPPEQENVEFIQKK